MKATVYFNETSPFDRDGVKPGDRFSRSEAQYETTDATNVYDFLDRVFSASNLGHGRARERSLSVNDVVELTDDQGVFLGAYRVASFGWEPAKVIDPDQLVPYGTWANAVDRSLAR